MKITFEFGSRDTQKLLRHVVRHAVRHYGVDPDAHDVEVVVVSMPRHDRVDKSYDMGTLVFEGEWSDQARGFMIGLYGEEGKASNTDIVLALVHEATHLAQILSGHVRLHQPEGCDDDFESAWWLGEGPAKLAYEDRPWEREAYDRQETVALALTRDGTFMAMLDGLQQSATE
jgi:hypothetical protein